MYSYVWQGQKDANPLFGGFALLDDQNLVDCGTRLRTLHLKNSPQDYFSLRCKPTLDSSPSYETYNKNKKHSLKNQRMLLLLWQGQKDLNPRHAVLEQIEVR